MLSELPTNILIYRVKNTWNFNEQRTFFPLYWKHSNQVVLSIKYELQIMRHLHCKFHNFAAFNKHCRARPCKWPKPYDPDFDLSMLDLWLTAQCTGQSCNKVWAHQTGLTWKDQNLGRKVEVIYMDDPAMLVKVIYYFCIHRKSPDFWGGGVMINI